MDCILIWLNEAFDLIYCNFDDNFPFGMDPGWPLYTKNERDGPSKSRGRSQKKSVHLGSKSGSGILKIRVKSSKSSKSGQYLQNPGKIFKIQAKSSESGQNLQIQAWILKIWGWILKIRTIRKIRRRKNAQNPARNPKKMRKIRRKSSKSSKSGQKSSKSGSNPQNAGKIFRIRAKSSESGQNLQNPGKIRVKFAKSGSNLQNPGMDFENLKIPYTFWEVIYPSLKILCLQFIVISWLFVLYDMGLEP